MTAIIKCVSRRQVLIGGAGAGVLALSGRYAHAAAGAWPSRVVKMISPYGAGGSNDISLRILSEYVGQRVDQQFVVENKPGAGTRIANEFVAHAVPDGYTFLYAAAPYITAEALFGKLNYERKELRPVAMAVLAPLFLIVNADTQIKTVQDLIAYGKSKKDGLTFGSPGPGSQPHPAAELLFKEAGVKGLNVPFRGDNSAYTELLAGRVDATLTAISAALPHIESGKLRVLGTASEQRSAIYPSAPTLREQGLSKVIAAGWFGFMAPAATPEPIIERLQAEVMRALSDDTVKQKLLAQGLEAYVKSGADFGAFIDRETEKWGGLIREAGLKGE
ncbi:tripartite-type tricarboxylate transporter receptor subunit TctC [Nitrobacteraceae bacterium AZCC 1564]